jgi:hypothetical protein
VEEFMSSIQHAFAAFGPGDTAILLLVSLLLLAIAWQLIVRFAHQRALAKWQRDLFYAMAEGLELEVTARPQIQESCTLPPQWKWDVQLWTTQTGIMLERYSAQAGISFRYFPEPGGFRAREVGGPSEYKALLVRLKNLHGIIEHPDAYL